MLLVNILSEINFSIYSKILTKLSSSLILTHESKSSTPGAFVVTLATLMQRLPI